MDTDYDSNKNSKTILAIRLPVTLGGIFNILMIKEETNTELLCGIVRDSLALQGAIIHTWAMITIIFRYKLINSHY